LTENSNDVFGLEAMLVKPIEQAKRFRGLSCFKSIDSGW